MSEDVEPYRSILMIEYVFVDGPAPQEVIEDYIMSRVTYDTTLPPDSVRLVTGPLADKVLSAAVTVEAVP